MQYFTMSVLQVTLLAITISSAFSCHGRGKDNPYVPLDEKSLVKGLSLLCERVECDFEDDLCSYHTLGDEAVQKYTPYRSVYRIPPTLLRRNRVSREVTYVSEDQLVSKSWTVSNSVFGNRNTGVRRPDSGNYAAAYVYEGEKAVMFVPFGFTLPKEVMVSYNGWEATVGIRLRMCCELHDASEYCPSESTSEADPEARSWFNYLAACPIGTEKIVFYCDNLGDNQGACGLDGVHLLRPGDKPSPFCQYLSKNDKFANLISRNSIIEPESPFGDLLTDTDYLYDYQI